MKTKKQTENAFVLSLLPDSDKKMGPILAASILVALGLGFWAAATEIALEDVFFEKTVQEEFHASMKIENKKEEKVEKKKEKKPKQEVKRKRQGSGGKPTGKGNPRAELKTSVLKILTTRTNHASAMAYGLMQQKFAKDIDKVLKNSNGIRLAGKTKIGERRGIVDGGFNEGLVSGGSGGVGDAITGLMGGSAGTLSLKAKMKIKPPSEKEIDFGDPSSSRSASDIMRVVRQRTPGLRHVYNKHLKKNPGFQGKVTLKFTIAPGGDIIRISIVSSTTGYGDFDNDVKNAVSQWTFGKVKSGNTTVTIPFTFSE